MLRFPEPCIFAILRLARPTCAHFYSVVQTFHRSPAVPQMKYYATTTRSKLGKEDANALKPPLPEILASIHVQKFPTDVVQESIEKVMANRIPGLDKIESPQAYFLFVRADLNSLQYLDAFVRHSCKAPGIALLTAVELTNTLFLLKNLSKRDRVPKVGLSTLLREELKIMSESFLILLLNNRSAQVSVPAIVGGLVNSSGSIAVFQKVFEAGLGNFLPEISMLPKQFNLSEMDSLEPIVNAISWLDQESLHSSLQQTYDEMILKTLITVMRFRHFLSALRDLNGIKPANLESIVNDPAASQIQSTLQETSGRLSHCDQLIFDKHRNLFNLFYCSTGLGCFESMLSVVLRSIYSDRYSDSEKATLTAFLQEFVPLIYNGTLTSNSLATVRYSSVIARFKDRVLVPHIVGDNIIDNYEFSLLVLVDMAHYAYIIRSSPSILSKSFAESSLPEIEESILEYAKEKGSLVKQDCESLITALKFFSSYALRSFTFLDKILKDSRLVEVMEKHQQKHQRPYEIDWKPRHISQELSREVNMPGCRVNLKEYSGMLLEFQDSDLKINFSLLSPRNVLRLLKEKNKFHSGGKVDDLIQVLQPDGETGFDTAKLDELTKYERFRTANRNKQQQPVQEYVQVPEFLKIHDFAEELAFLRDKVIKKDFQGISSNKIIDHLKSYLDYLDVANARAVRLTKLANRLTQLFAINGNDTEVLDAVIRSHQVFHAFEAKLQKDQTKLLDSNSYIELPENCPMDTFAQKKIAQIEKNTMATYQSKISKQKNYPVGTKTLVSEVSAVESAQTNDEAAQNDANQVKPLVKPHLEKFLRKAKQEKVSEMEERFREREAYMWSTGISFNHRKLDTKHFFSPYSKKLFPMFPGKDRSSEYLVLTSQGHTLYAKTNPLGAMHIPEDMLSIVERLSEAEIVKYLAHLGKLQRNGWMLIGSKGPNTMLVLCRPVRSYKWSIFRTAQLFFASAGVVLVTLLGVDYFVEVPAPLEEEKRAKSRPNNNWRTRVSEEPGSGPVARGEELKRNAWTLLLWK